MWTDYTAHVYLDAFTSDGFVRVPALLEPGTVLYEPTLAPDDVSDFTVSIANAGPNAALLRYALFCCSTPICVQWGENRLCVLGRHCAGTA